MQKAMPSCVLDTIMQRVARSLRLHVPWRDRTGDSCSIVIDLQGMQGLMIEMAADNWTRN